MSTLEREVMDADGSHPSTSTALVPLPRVEAPQEERPRAETAPSHAHRYFYGMGYAALALIVLGTWVGSANATAGIILFTLAAPLLGIAGLGVLLHVAYRPRMEKLRMGLGAIASLVLTVAALGPLDRAAREVHAQSVVLRLQPLADDLLRNGRIRVIDLPSPGWIELNGFVGRMDTSDPSQRVPSLTLAEVLRRDGISRLELVRTISRMERAGASRAEVGASYVRFQAAGDDVLLYARPGHAPPPMDHVVENASSWHTKPLGGGWYLYLSRTADPGPL